MTTPSSPPELPSLEPRNFAAKVLDWIERVGNRLPDPAVLFIVAMFITWVVSWWLAGYQFEVPSKTGTVNKAIASQVTGEALVTFLTDMVKTFTGFHPLGVVLVALLGMGVAERAGLIDAGIKILLLSWIPKALLTPAIIFVAVVSHTAADAGYVVVIPLGGVIFHAAGRHPLAGIAAAFAGVSGGFSANFIPSGIDPLLQGLTQAGASILDAEREVNPLCNWFFTSASCALVIAVGWLITDFLIEPRLKRTVIDGDPEDLPKSDGLSSADRRGFAAAILSLAVSLSLLAWVCFMPNSPFADPNPPEGVHGLLSLKAPLMKAIVPLIFLLSLIPGLVHGYVSGAFKSHRDVIKAMGHAMSTMGYYMVMAFFAALFIYSFGKSGIGALLAVKGADALRGLPPSVTIVGIILLCAAVNLLVGSASAKWALLAPIFVPMLMQLGISPELTQAAYRVGDSTTNIVTPLMPYFPLVVAFCQRYVKNTGIGTVVSLMLPFSIGFLILWTIFLLAYWQLDFSLGLQSTYTYP